MQLLFRSPSQIYLIFVSPKVCSINEPFTPFTPFTPRNKAILDVWLKLVISQEEQIFQFPHYPFPQNYTLCTKQSKQYHFYEKVCMSSSSTHVVVREGRDCLAPAASPGVASSDIIRLYCWPLFARTTTLINYVQLCATFCNIFSRGKLFCKLSMDDETGVALKCPRFRIFPRYNFGRRGFWHMFTSQHAWKERLDLSWMSLELCGLVQNLSSLAAN